jgi:hypothetical protein
MSREFIPIVAGLGLLAFGFLFHMWIKAQHRRIQRRRAAAPVCPTCCEFADSRSHRAALCPDPSHREAARRRVAKMRGEV